MTNKLTLTEQEELFAKDCKLINLKYEYNGYTGAYSAKTEHSLRMSGALFRQERIIALLVNKVTCFLHVYRDLESLIDMLQRSCG